MTMASFTFGLKKPGSLKVELQLQLGVFVDADLTYQVEYIPIYYSERLRKKFQAERRIHNLKKDAG